MFLYDRKGNRNEHTKILEIVYAFFFLFTIVWLYIKHILVVEHVE